MSGKKLRTFTVEVPVNYDQAWADAIRQGAPNTGSGWAIWGVEDQFPTDQKVVITEKQRWVQFGPSYRHQVALDYAKDEKLAHIHPRGIFSLTEAHPKIVEEQDEDVMYLNSGLICAVGGGVLVPRVECYRDGFRKASILGVRYEFYGFSWFGFRE